MNLTIIFEFATGMYRNKRKLLLAAVPVESELAGAAVDSRAFGGRSYFHAGQINVKFKDKLVFIRPGDPAESVKKVVASTVWLESLCERNDLGWDGGAVLPDYAINLPNILGERKVVIPLSRTQLDSGGVDGLVESVTQIVESIGSNDAQTARELLSNPKFIEFIAGLSVEVDDWCGAAFLKEGIAPNFQIIDAFPSPFD